MTDIEREENAGETDSEGRKAWVYGYDLPVESIIEVVMSANEDAQRKRAALCWAIAVHNKEYMIFQFYHSILPLVSLFKAVHILKILPSVVHIKGESEEGTQRTD